MRNIICILAFCVLALSAWSLPVESYNPAELPKPLGVAKGVYDPGKMMSETQCIELSRMLEELSRNVTVGGAIAVIPSIGDMEINDYATRLYENWKPGNDDKDNGFLIVVAVEEHKIFICTGYGLEGVLPDVTCAGICEKYFVPYMREGNLYEGLVSTLTALISILENPDNKGEVMSEKVGGMEVLSKYDFWQIMFWICSALTCLSLFLFIFDVFSVRKKDNYTKAQLWRNHLSLYWVLGIFSLGMGIIFPIIVLFLRKYYRSKRLKCDTCGAKMNKLGEKEDNMLLSPSQDLEERLDTVDYDVWVCPKCGTIERFPFKIKQTKYSECPKCHTIANKLVCDKIIVQPTSRREGLGERIYHCEYCGNDHREKYRIPRQDNGAGGAIIAGAALGGLSGLGGRGGSSGGGWTGPFGGGMTGGGGGGASW
ncbi:MAG: TPM domain-containing protein [Prevotella sp.]|nr:TPM domain-containing protein [Bacteroides sp.]MCM1366453.1 TPM domain-containing protein [Prevotella sp.]MCM1437067.1 TPM domain-containing protein [Prevotella sp.]